MRSASSIACSRITWRSCVSGATSRKSLCPSRRSNQGDRLSPIAAAIHARGPLTVAAFMDLALYDPELGYYARAAQRSGRAGDFFTSVDVGPLFGELLEIQLAEMFGTLQKRQTTNRRPQTHN